MGVDFDSGFGYVNARDAMICACGRDYGDAPDSYLTLDASGGPSHGVLPGLQLGSCVDSESDGVPATAGSPANGDDMGAAVGLAGSCGASGDEDADPVLTTYNGSGTYMVDIPVVNTTGSDAYLVGYIDWNGDGNFGDINGGFVADPGEQSDTVTIISQPTPHPIPPTPVDYSLTWTDVPANPTSGVAYARLRVSTDQTAAESPGGYAHDGEVEDYEIAAGSLPVTLSFFESFYINKNKIRIDWNTSTETMNIGFYLWGYAGDEKIKINEEIIPSNLTDSLVPQYYTEIINTSDIAGDITRLALSTIDITGKEEFHGPYKLGEKYGEPPNEEPIDWYAIRDGINKNLRKKGILLRGNTLRTSRALIQSNAAGGPKDSQSAVCNLTIDSKGITRVTYEQLQAAGCDYDGANPVDLAIVYKGSPIAREIHTGNTLGNKFGSGGYIDFYAELPEGEDSIYLKENTYQIKVDKLGALGSKAVNKKPSGQDSSYTETALRHHNLIYSFTMPTPFDPWYERRIFSRGSPVFADFVIAAQADAITSEPATLTLGLAGGIAPQNVDPDHHIKIYFNGDQVGEFFNDGIVDWVIEIPLTGNTINTGENTVRVEVVGDTGFPFDIVNLNFIKLLYERPFTAISDKLRFEESSQADFKVTGLSSDNIAAYGFDGADLYLLKTETTNNGSSFDVSVPNVQSDSPVKYWVSTQSAINNASVSLARQNTGILEGFADYLIISHPAFIGPELDSYVQNKESEGYAVKVVDLLDIYDDHGFGMATPFSIRNYLKEAQATIGFEHVLFVGADSYDYHNNTNSGVISFLPTMYAKTNFLIFFTPTDSLIADLDGDEIQDLAIGRWPVRTTSDLNTIINKTADYSSNTQSTALMIAEHTAANQEPFKNQTDRIADNLPFDPLNIVKIYIDDFLEADPDLDLNGAITQARNAMVDTINNGIDVTVFSGHGAPTMWTFNGLMTPSVAQGLTNAGKPTFVMPLSCYTTYHLLPTLNSLSHQLLAAGDKGAVVVTGAISLSSKHDNEQLANGIIDKMFNQNKTFGQAVLETKQQLGIGFRDVVINWQTLGDPTLKMNQ